ncbi:heavy metal-associated domain-containing protein [Virgibacillus alimentarius]|uniref:heavy metal-associated domain-containing protein n=1 Tax=Virgibacillus alimentarius TaxID=698769 RepID=UPI0004932EF9|nr:heavy metal-associated domain-containing protein [Virgibacillus alimentarius]
MTSQVEQLAESKVKNYRIQGLDYANCAKIFEENVKELPGIQEAKVNFGASKIASRRGNNSGPGKSRSI